VSNIPALDPTEFCRLCERPLTDRARQLADASTLAGFIAYINGDQRRPAVGRRIEVWGEDGSS
jgi:hypothetical protein